MARYGLIMKDVTYMKLMKKAAESGISMGRLLNNIVDRAVADMESDIIMKCAACELPPTFKVWKGNQTFLVCDFHYEEEKNWTTTKRLDE